MSGIKTGDRVRVTFEGFYSRGPMNVKSMVALDTGSNFNFTEGRDEVQVEKVVPQPPTTYRSVLLHKATGDVYVLDGHGVWRNAVSGVRYGDGEVPDDWAERYEVLHDAGKEN